MDCVGANVLGSADDSFYVEIRRADRNRFIARASVWSVPVRVCIDHGGTDSHLTASARDAYGNLAPVRYQKFSNRQETNYVTKTLIDIILTFRKTLDHGLQTLLIDSIGRLFSSLLRVLQRLLIVAQRRVAASKSNVYRPSVAIAFGVVLENFHRLIGLLAVEQETTVLMNLSGCGAWQLQRGLHDGFSLVLAAHFCQDQSFGAERVEVCLAHEWIVDCGIGPLQTFLEIRVALRCVLRSSIIGTVVEAGCAGQFLLKGSDVAIGDIVHLDGPRHGQLFRLQLGRGFSRLAFRELIGEPFAIFMLGGFHFYAQRIVGIVVKEAAPRT